MPRPFEDYFKNRTVLVGGQSSVGDEILVKRSGTIFRASSVFNKAFASINHNSTPITIAAQDVWYPITGMTDQMSTQSFSFASDAYTYIGPTQIYPCSISLSATLSKIWSGNGGEEYEIGIFLNGAQLQNTMSTVCIEDATQAFKTNVTSIVGHILVQNDVIDARILNRSGTDNVIVEDLQLVIQQ